MIVDSSALIAVVSGEEDGARIHEVLLNHLGRVRMSAATLLETQIVVDRRDDPVLARRLDQLIETYAIEVVPFTEDLAKISRGAYRDFGKGSGHRAQLNFGDCISYALAAHSGEPLLCKGNDFAHTDLALA
ncbi:MAG: type II toxin-antitoxin system VapC family toxin [Fimbriimonas sp.]